MSHDATSGQANKGIDWSSVTEKFKKADDWIDNKIVKVKDIGKTGYTMNTNSTIDKKIVIWIGGAVVVIMALYFFVFKKKR